MWTNHNVSNINIKISHKDFFNKLSGEGTFEYLEERVKSPPWEIKWKHSEKKQEKNYSRVNPFAEEAQKSARKWLPKIKKDVLNFGKSKGYLPKSFDMNILLISPKEGKEWIK